MALSLAQKGPTVSIERQMGIMQMEMEMDS